LGTIRKRVGKKGVSYSVVIRRTGHKTHSQTFPTEKEAIRWDRMKEAELDKSPTSSQVDHSKPSKDNYTVNDMIARYLDEVQSHKKPLTQLTQRHQIRYWKDTLGYLPVRELTPSRIAQEQNKLKVGRKDPAVSSSFIIAGQ
jgi:hypothetical protein